MNALFIKKKFFSFICLVLFSFSLESVECYGNLNVKNLIRIHDGDTFIVDIENIHPIVGKSVSVRIKGIDAPEMTSHDSNIKALAIQSRDYLAERLKDARSIKLVNVQRDKYFRILAEVYLDGVEIGSELIKMGLALPYDGRTKPLWESK